MNSLYENRNSQISTLESKPLHMICPNCNADWLGYLVHEVACTTPDYVWSKSQK